MLGAGVLDADLRPLEPTALRPRIGSRVQYFRWMDLAEQEVVKSPTYIDVADGAQARDAGAHLAERALEGLDRLGAVC